MSFKITWTKEAILSYSEIIVFILETNDTNAYALRVQEEVDKVLNQLAIYPFSGFRTNKKIRQVLVLRNYYLFYQIDEVNNLIKVLRLWDNRQSPKKLKKYI